MGRHPLHAPQVRRFPGQLGDHRHRRRIAERKAQLDRCGGQRRIRLGRRAIGRCAMTYSGYLLPPYARPIAQAYAGLARPDIIWEDERWYRFTERTDLHEVRYLEVRQDGQTVALAPLLITAEPGGLLFYDPPRLAGTAGALAEPELLDPSDQQ